MKSLSSTLSKLILSILCVTVLVNCEQPEESTDDGGSETVTFSGAYYSSCVPEGAPVANGNYTNKMIHYQPDGDFEYVTYYYSDAACTSEVYAVIQDGTYAVGPATSVPSGGYEVAYAISDLYLAYYTDAARTALMGGCGVGGTWSAAPSLKTLFAAWGCANISVAAPNTIFYNVASAGSTTAEIGIPDNDNPGVVNVGNINIGATLSFSK
ncbi:hypothetical protein [Bdellovibrio sp. HCB2-146]|uniref:hypothetical protein n=1 Tax=Bdellovibrio sp. HCB2-146 TaxID=3394362 RepID=UPI0039BD5C97